MIKKIIQILLISYLLNNINIYAESKKVSNGVLFYEQCNILINKNNKENITNLGSNLCIFIKNKNTDNYTILAKRKNNFGFEIINEDTLKYLKKNYYRGEKININFIGFKKIIRNDISFNIENINNYDTLDSDYSINFLDDNLLSKNNYFKILNDKCNFNSYIPNCNDKTTSYIIKKIEEKLVKNFLNLEKILDSSENRLIKEKNKINIIKNKIIDLEKQFYKKQEKDENKKYSENVFFTFKFIIYKLDIYNKILENRLGDLKFNKYLKENKIYFIDKKLVGDLFISQNDEFTFFYNKDILINTLKNSITHFDDDELSKDSNISESNLEYLKKKIIEKYSASFIKKTDNNFILINKKYLSKTKYLFFDTTNNKIFNFYGDIEEIEKGKKGYYILLEDYKGGKYLVLYDGKEVQIIIEPSNKFDIFKFELLEGKKIKIFYSNNEKGNNEKIIDISEY